jgi:hypothetical protein
MSMLIGGGPVNAAVIRSNKMPTLEITVASDQHVAKVFKVLKPLESGLDLGCTLKAIRNQTAVVSRDFGGIHSVQQLTDILVLIDSIHNEGIQFELTLINLQPGRSIKERPTFIRTPTDRNDILRALNDARTIAEEQAQQAAKMRNWLASEEGQRYTATRERLSHVRATIETRWEKLGYENLSNYEREYINVWWLCVEVETGGFGQYFYNSYGDNSMATLSALITIAANGAHAALSDALAGFQPVGGFAPDRQTRCEKLLQLPHNAFENANSKFYDLNEDVRELALLHVERGYAEERIAIEEIG